MNQSIIQKRSKDNPVSWACMFVILAIVTVPFYCITRRTWKPLIFTFASSSAPAIAWGVILAVISSGGGADFQDSPDSESILYLLTLIGLYIGGFYSVKVLRRDALAQIKET